MSLAAMPLSREVDTPALTTEQWRFLWLHVRQVVVRWQWHFSDTLLRAHAERGDTASISRADVDELVALGLMARIGDAGHALTAEGIRVGK